MKKCYDCGIEFETGGVTFAYGETLHFCYQCHQATLCERAREIEEERHPENFEPDDSMDGDHESALASAGWGTDEDYGGGMEHL